MRFDAHYPLNDRKLNRSLYAIGRRLVFLILFIVFLGIIGITTKSQAGNNSSLAPDVTELIIKTANNDDFTKDPRIDSYITMLSKCLNNSKVIGDWMSCETQLYYDCVNSTDGTGVSKKMCGLILSNALSRTFDALSAKAINKDASFPDYLVRSELDYRAYSYEVCAWPYFALSAGTDRSVLSSECSLRVLAERLYELNEAMYYLMQR
jgi:hypothetical protein